MEDTVSTRYPFALLKEKLAARHGNVADFAIGAGHMPLPETLVEWIREHASLAMQAASPADMAAFKEAASSLLHEEYGVQGPGIGILATTGARMAMSAIVACLVQPGDDVLVTEPGYPVFARLVAHRGAGVHTARLDPEAGFLPDVRALGNRARADRGFKLVFLNYPNNPTGAVWSDAVRQRVLEVAGNPGTIIVNDAMYGPLSYASAPHSLLGEALPGTAGIATLELHALTKLYPVGPLSVSFLAGTTSLIDELANYTEFASSPPSSLQVRATTWCLRDVAGRTRRRQYIEARLQALQRTLEELGFAPYVAQGGVYMLCRAPARIGGIRIESAADAAARLLDDFDLAVVPWTLGPDSYLRFSALYRDEDLQRLAGLSDRLELSQS